MVNAAAAPVQRPAATWRRRLSNVVLLAGVLTVLVARTAHAHPLHTTLTQVSIDARDGSARVVIRAFIDDFGAAAARLTGKSQSPDHSVSEGVLQAYVAAKVALVDAHNQRVPLSWEGVRREGDVVWLTLRAPTVKALRGVRFGTALLFEKFEDQVNIVQVSDGSARRSMLFTRGDSGKVKVLL